MSSLMESGSSAAIHVSLTARTSNWLDSMTSRTRAPLLTALRAFSEPKLMGAGRAYDAAGPGLDSIPPSNSSIATSIHGRERLHDGRKNPHGPRSAKQDRRKTVRLAHGEKAYGEVAAVGVAKWLKSDSLTLGKHRS